MTRTHRSAARRGARPSTAALPTFRSLLAASSARLTVLAAAFVLTSLMVSGTQVGTQVRTPESGPVDRAAALVRTHDCWTGRAPRGVVPGHAVVTRPGQQARMVPARVGFAIWLDGRPGVVHAFCR